MPPLHPQNPLLPRTVHLAPLNPHSPPSPGGISKAPPQWGGMFRAAFQGPPFCSGKGELPKVPPLHPKAGEGDRD